jgi:AcrR family transcriptional regulator
MVLRERHRDRPIGGGSREVAQVKKKAVRDAIVASATRLFSEQGYNRTTLGAIAADAGLSAGNIYLYFPSKIALLYEVYRPWFQDWFAGLERKVRAVASPRLRLHRLLTGFWYDLPASNPRLANSLVEALSTEDPGMGKPDDLIRWTEGRLTALLREILPHRQHRLLQDDLFAHTLVMAQDGFIINYRLGTARNGKALAARMVDLILGESDDPA